MYNIQKSLERGVYFLDESFIFFSLYYLILFFLFFSISEYQNQASVICLGGASNTRLQFETIKLII